MMTMIPRTIESQASSRFLMTAIVPDPVAVLVAVRGFCSRNPRTNGLPKTLNQRVQGSSPWGVTKFTRLTETRALVFETRTQNHSH